ncbi:MAG TPA: hypothetical protein VHV75_19360 [Solirubrobacteraceae bacterium]|jgi:hypothetical protein|nr:hypothetical protein [Solirubrobacteraceae bacterium]
MSSEDRIGEIAALIAQLRPPPEGWVRAAKELPLASRALESGIGGLRAVVTPLPGPSGLCAEKIDGGVSRAR